MNLVPAHAKLNLALGVVGRDGGRHRLSSVIVRLDWHDLVGVELVPGGGRVELVVTGGRGGEVPAVDNLMERAARAILPAGSSQAGARLLLEKRLPVAAGLGGGSADAAAVLRLLADGGPDPPPWLFAVADGLGADVPACLAGGSLLVGGTGERLARLRHDSLHLAVALAGRSSTAATFAELTPAEHRGGARAEELARRLTAGQPVDSELCGSDLEAAACRANPDLRRCLQRLRGVSPGTPWHLTGSGGAAFALAADAPSAAELAAAAQACGFPARRCRTVDAPTDDCDGDPANGSRTIPDRGRR